MFPEIPGFKIIELIGEGGMAKVYLAEQLFNERKVRNVALKVMDQELSADPSFRDRFLKEAEDTARFNHEGIVTIYTMDVHDGHYYLALEFLDSGTLKERLEDRLKYLRESGGTDGVAFGVAESLVLLRQLAEALDYAHEQGVIHRDLKPANILFRKNGHAVLSDFGIAKSTRKDQDLTLAGFAIGTPAYMSPEQRWCQTIDERSDLYSLGVVFYEILTGKKPFDTRTPNRDELVRRLMELPQLPTELSHLQGLLDRLLAFKADDRFQNAKELIREIDALSPGLGTEGDRTVVQRRTTTQEPGWSRRKIMIAVAAAASLSTIVALTIWLWPDPAPVVVPVDEETAREIEGLLGTAKLFVDMGDLIDSSPSNAIDVYSRVLQLQPGNPQATTGLESAFGQILAQIESHIENGNLDEARRLIELSEHYFPEDKRLSKLRNQAKS